MKKADWSKAPEWAQFYAVDHDGESWWFERCPVYNTSERYWYRDNDVGRAQSAGPDCLYIESRPTS